MVLIAWRVLGSGREQKRESQKLEQREKGWAVVTYITKCPRPSFSRKKRPGDLSGARGNIDWRQWRRGIGVTAREQGRGASALGGPTVG